MPSLEQLKQKCRDAGLRTTGRKSELERRLAEHRPAHSTTEPDGPDPVATQLAHRVRELEEAIARIQARDSSVANSPEWQSSSNRFQPLRISSPQHASLIEFSRNGDVTNDCTMIPANRPTVTFASGEPGIRHSSATSCHEPQVVVGSGGVTGVTASNNTPLVEGVATPMPTRYTVPPPSIRGSMHHGSSNHGMPWPNMEQGPGYNNVCSIKDLVSILPEFNPVSEDSLNPRQFVKRIQALRDAYQWRDDLLIFAVQQKLKGHARYWADSQLEVCTSWQQFTQKFLIAFPCRDNEADGHIKLASMKRGYTVTPQEYVYKMLAFGTKHNIAECAIIRHIIGGINDNELKRRLSRDYESANELLRDIDNYCRFNEVRGCQGDDKDIHMQPTL